VFEARRLGELAAVVDGLRAAPRTEGWPPPRADRKRPLPTTPGQKRTWFFQLRDPRSAAQHLAIVLRLHGSMQPFALEQALDEVVRRHETLRTTYTEIDGELRAVVRAELPTTLEQLDLEGADAEALRAAIDEEVSRPFDLRSASPLRAQLVRIADDEHVLVLTVHHIASDGWSNAVLVRDLAAYYRALSADEPPALPEPSLPYVDFAVWQEGWLAGEQAVEQIAWWRRTLEDAPPVSAFPPDEPPGPDRAYVGAYEAFELDAGLVVSVQRLAREEGATPFAVLLAAFAVLLARASGQRDLVVGTLTAGRGRPEMESTVGFVADVLPLRLRLVGAQSFREVLRRSRDAAFAGFAHQDVPFDHVLEALRLPRVPNQRPVFQSMLALQNAPRPDFDAPGLTAVAEPYSMHFSSTDVMIRVFEAAGGEAGPSLHCVLEYDTELYRSETAKSLVSDYVALLCSVVSDPDLPL
jgi:hypothetical protein